MNDKTMELVTRRELRLSVRQTGPKGGPILTQLFHHVSQEDLRFRFLSGLNEIGPEQLRSLTPIHDGKAVSFLAL